MSVDSLDSLRLSPRATVSLSQARELVRVLSTHESLLLVAPPGVGKTEMIREVGAELGLEVRSVLGTQLAPEDLSGLPRLVGDRTVFCPPRVLLPTDNTPFLLFLDELPSASPDVQKAMYSLLLERRIGEHALPPGSRVVAAGNRASDHAIVRGMSSALLNRVFVLEIEVSVGEWLAWAAAHGVREEVRDFIRLRPAALLREPSGASAPFSTPRAWVSLASALDALDRAALSNESMRRALAFGRVSASDASLFLEASWQSLRCASARDLVEFRAPLPPSCDAAFFMALEWIGAGARSGDLDAVAPSTVRAFLDSLALEYVQVLRGGAPFEWERLEANAMDPELDVPLDHEFLS